MSSKSNVFVCNMNGCPKAYQSWEKLVTHQTRRHVPASRIKNPSIHIRVDKNTVREFDKHDPVA
jgi:hypothetical protein